MMAVENHMVIHDSDYHREMSDPCEGCKGYDASDCCNAPIKWGDICEECGEHCETQCEECVITKL